MESIERENEFARLHVIDGCLVSGAKRWLLKIGYSYSYFSSTGMPTIERIKVKVPITSIKKMRIVGMGILTSVFFILAAFAFGMGFYRGIDQDTGLPGTTHVATGSIIAIVLALAGILFMRSGIGRVKILHTSVDGNMPTLIYASTNKEELKSLRELIRKYAAGEIDEQVHQPPPLPHT